MKRTNRGMFWDTLEARQLFAIAGLPRPDHIVIVLEENKGDTQIVGSAAAPYITSLANGGAYFSKSYAIEHPSQPNYLDLFAGGNQGVTDDNLPANLPFSSPNLAANLRAKGFTFADYSESLPNSGLTTDSSIGGGYRRKHNPVVNWQNDASPTANQVPSSMNRDLSAFPTDFTQLPTVSFVIPTQNNDMHDGSIATGDAWLKAKMDAYAQWAKTHNSLLIVTFDEDDNSLGNRISTIFYGQPAKTGVYSGFIDHYSVLRTLEDIYGTAYAGASATSAPIIDCWNALPTSIATPITTGSAWKYLDTGASLDAVNWKSTSYNDTAWKTGNAQLGYGDGDEATVVSYGPSSSSKYTTTYFRKTISIANPGVISTLNLAIMRDDGAVVYLNGIEVARTNMPTGTIKSATAASGAIDSLLESSYYSFGIDPKLLVAGNNTISVEIHQATASSSDISFDLALSASTILNTASITGKLWNDTDADGVIDTGEASLASRTVYIDSNNNAIKDSTEKSTITDSAGAYNFASLLAGTYIVRQVVPAGWSQTSPTANAAQSVVLTTGQAATAKNFGSKTTAAVAGSIAGYLWSDTNGNGVKDGTEGFTASREVYLDTNKNGTKDTGEVAVMSDASGNYKFSNLTAGTYRVRRTPLPAGYRYSSPLVGYYDVVVASGANVAGKNIGVTQRAIFSGTVFKDTNANKLKDTGELGLSGWKVFIDTNGNGLLDTSEKSVTTDASGNFIFNDVLAGTYKFRLQNKTGFTITTPTGGLTTVALANAQVKSGVLFGVK